MSVETLETLGTYLKREREFRQIPLIEVAASTRIPLPYLNALEADKYAELPAKTFVRGYIKAYAQHVGLDETDLLLRFEQSLAEAAAPNETTTKRENLAALAPRRRWSYLWYILLFGTLVGAAVYLSRL